jgi:hypothetical protein
MLATDMRSFFFVDRAATREDGSVPSPFAAKGAKTGPPAGPVG